MGYNIHPVCVMCGRDYSKQTGEAYPLARAVVSRNYNGNGHAAMLGTKKFVICPTCLMEMIVERKYPNLKIPKDCLQDMKFHAEGEDVLIGPEKRKALKKGATQEDADKMIRNIAIDLLKGKKK